MTTTLLAERSAIEAQLRDARAERAKVAAADRNDPRLPKLRQAILDLEGQLEDLTAADQEIARSSQKQLRTEGIEARRMTLKSVASETRKQIAAVAAIEKAANDLSVAFDEHHSSVQRARAALHRHCPTPHSRDVLDGLQFELPARDIVGVLCRAGLAPYVANPAPVSPESLETIVRGRLDRLLVRATALLDSTPTGEPEQ